MNTDPVHPVDAWIEAIPESAYDPCPCGCGQKWKFVRARAEDHEARFLVNLGYDKNKEIL